MTNNSCRRDFRQVLVPFSRLYQGQNILLEIGKELQNHKSFFVCLFVLRFRDNHALEGH